MEETWAMEDKFFELDKNWKERLRLEKQENEEY